MQKKQVRNVTPLLPTILLLWTFSAVPLFAQAADNGVIITQHEGITVLGNNGRNQWLIKISQPSPTITLMDMNTHKMFKFPVEESGIISAQFQYLPYIRDSVIEVIACSDNGTGHLYLFTADFKLLLKTEYFDSYQENVSYAVFHAIKPFAARNNMEETISRVYRDYHLEVDYKNVKDKAIKVAGFCDYISHTPEKTETVYSEQIEKIYKYSDSAKAFELVKNISALENPLWPE